MRKKVLFVDTHTAKPYDESSLRTEAIGGTQSSVLRVAEGLGAWHDVYVAHHLRPSDLPKTTAATFITLESALSMTGAQRPDVVVNAVGRFEEVPQLTRRYPGARLVIWSHDLRRIRRVWKYRRTLAAGRWTVVTVSKFHAGLAREHAHGKGLARLLDRVRPRAHYEIRTIYNSIADGLAPDDTPVDPWKLLFFSAPAKGLGEVIVQFRAVYAHDPRYRLYVAHPGYSDPAARRGFDARMLEEPGIVLLGPQSHPQMMQHVRESFCVFFPQRSKPETFGLVYAEANALGTPVLAHRFGAAEEVLSDPDQLIDAGDPEAALRTLLRWRERGRPRVHLREQFKVAAVVEEWRKLVEEPQPGVGAERGAPSTGRGGA